MRPALLLQPACYAFDYGAPRRTIVCFAQAINHATRCWTKSNHMCQKLRALIVHESSCFPPLEEYTKKMLDAMDRVRNSLSTISNVTSSTYVNIAEGWGVCASAADAQRKIGRVRNDRHCTTARQTVKLPPRCTTACTRSACCRPHRTREARSLSAGLRRASALRAWDPQGTPRRPLP